MPAVTALVQLNIVPPMLDVGVKFSAAPLQIVACNCDDVLVITGTGFTVTVTLIGVPLHPFDVGVIV